MNTDKLYLCKKCFARIQRNSSSKILLSVNYDNADLDLECDVCGSVSAVLLYCEIFWKEAEI